MHSMVIKPTVGEISFLSAEEKYEQSLSYVPTNKPIFFAVCYSDELDVWQCLVGLINDIKDLMYRRGGEGKTSFI